MGAHMESSGGLEGVWYPGRILVAGSLETPVCCGVTDRQEIPPRVICSQGPGVRCERLLAACLPAGICPLPSHHWSDPR
eukprot:817676-Pyramimonas_sp.AAC.1